jgi:hypothetical protein
MKNMRERRLYGLELEVVELTKRQEVELEVAELKMLRFALGLGSDEDGQD